MTTQDPNPESCVNTISKSKKSSTNSQPLSKGYLVGWLTTLAQDCPTLVKTEDGYAKYTEAENVGPNFYLIHTSLGNKTEIKNHSSHTLNEIAFHVTIHQIAYSDNRFNRFLLGIPNIFKSVKKALRGRPFNPKSQEGIEHLEALKFEKLLKRSKCHAGIEVFKPRLESVENPIELELKMKDSLPCGVCQFKVTGMALPDDNLKIIDDTLWKCIFDEIHLFFHNHHFHSNSLQSLPENKPIFYTSRPKLREADNPNIVHFIREVGNSLMVQLDDIYKSYQILLIRNKGRREKGQPRISNKKRRKSAMSFFESCDNLIGIHAFLNSVLNSPQNESIVVRGSGRKKKCKEDMETAMKIESAHKGTIALMQKISHHHDFRTNKRAVRLAFIAMWISIFFGGISVIFTSDSPWKNFINWITSIWP